MKICCLLSKIVQFGHAGQLCQMQTKLSLSLANKFGYQIKVIAATATTTTAAAVTAN